MALTTQQELALFEVLEVPFATSVGDLSIDDDHLLAQVRQVTEANKAAKTVIQSWHQSLTSEVEAQLVIYLNQWIALGVDMTVIDQGSIGSIAGVSDSPAVEREEIRRRVLTICPFSHGSFSKQVRSPARKNSGAIEVIR